LKLKIINKEPFSFDLEEFKVYARITTNSDDALLETLLNTAFEQTEAITNRALSITEYELYLDEIKTFELPRAPFVELKSVEKLDGNDYVLFTGFKLDDKDEVAKVFIDEPFICENINCLKVSFKAGYSEIPKDLKIYCFAKALTMYEYRGSLEDVQVNKVDNPFLEGFIDKYKIRTFV